LEELIKMDKIFGVGLYILFREWLYILIYEFEIELSIRLYIDILLNRVDL